MINQLVNINWNYKYWYIEKYECKYLFIFALKFIQWWFNTFCVSVLNKINTEVFERDSVLSAISFSKVLSTISSEIKIWIHPRKCTKVWALRCWYPHERAAIMFHCPFIVLLRSFTISICSLVSMSPFEDSNCWDRQLDHALQTHSTKWPKK